MCLYEAIILAWYALTQVKKVVFQVNNVSNTETFGGAERLRQKQKWMDKVWKK